MIHDSTARSSTLSPAPDFRTLFESAPDPYLVLTRDFTIVAVSDAYLRATMTKRPELLGRGLFEVFPDSSDDLAATGVSNLRASLERVVRHGVADAMAVRRYDIRRPEPEGGELEERYWSPVNSPVLGERGEVAYIIHRVEDVTEFIRLKKLGREQERQTAELRLHAEAMEAEIYLRAQQVQEANQALRTANEELSKRERTLTYQNETLRQIASELEVTHELLHSQQLMQAIVDGTAAEIHVKDAEGRLLLVNRGFESALARSRDDLVGRSDSELYSPEVVDRIRARDRQVLATGAPIEYEEEVVRGNQRQTHLCVEFPLFHLSGQPYAVCGISTDVTAARRLEAQLRQSQKMEAIGQLAGGVAHDFNNLVTAILGYSRLVAADLAERPDLRDYVDQIHKAGERAAALTRQLLAFSRNQALRPQVVALNTVVAGIETMLRRLIGEDIELVTTLHPDCGQVRVDPSQLEQVIVNLAVNARDAMAGGGTLSLETAKVELDASYVAQHADSHPGPHALLAVSDTGRGMDADTRSHLFEPFFTTKEVGRGTGLGLSTVYGIVRQSGGHVEVYSEPGRGSVFRIFLPQAAAGAESGAPAGALPRDLPRGSETVLLVEDDDILRQLIHLLLDKAGYKVLCETSAAGALARAGTQAEPIHLVLTDVVMPGMSGPELASLLASRLPAARVLYMSGYTADVIARRSLLPPGAPFLEKPFRGGELLRKVREVLGAPRS
jgi:PAS domain S-box-containing protein